MYLRWYNAIVYQANYALSLIILSIYFLTLYKKSMSRQAWQVLLLISILSLIITMVLFDPGILSLFNSRSAAFVSVMITLHTVIYFYLKLLNPEVEKITRTRSFWFVTGLFAYYSGSFFIVATYRSFIQQRQDHFLSLLWSTHNVIFFLMCVSFSIGFACKKYQTT